MTNNKNFFAIDFVKKTITGSKASFKKASKGMGAEYEELKVKMAAHPKYSLVEKEQKSTDTKKTYHGLNFKFMETYISIQPNKNDLMVRYENAKSIAKSSNIKVYPLVKKWFLEEFDGFDMDKAFAAIINYNPNLINAVSSVANDEKNALGNVIVTNQEKNLEKAS